MLVTFGHGTLTRDDFTQLLHQVGAGELIDVRSYPGSRRVPQFGRTQMESWVPEAGIAYSWQPALGGRRRPVRRSRNVAWANASFRAYADYMETDEFRAALAEVAAAAADRTVVVMCAESVWWRCHRRLIADAAVELHGSDVRHLFHDGRLTKHRPSPQARVEHDGEPTLIYDIIDEASNREQP
jgi:uncharacterized protein (DUF488 family)